MIVRSSNALRRYERARDASAIRLHTRSGNLLDRRSVFVLAEFEAKLEPHARELRRTVLQWMVSGVENFDAV